MIFMYSSVTNSGLLRQSCFNFWRSSFLKVVFFSVNADQYNSGYLIWYSLSYTFIKHQCFAASSFSHTRTCLHSKFACRHCSQIIQMIEACSASLVLHLFCLLLSWIVFQFLLFNIIWIFQGDTVIITLLGNFHLLSKSLAKWNSWI